MVAWRRSSGSRYPRARRKSAYAASIGWEGRLKGRWEQREGCRRAIAAGKAAGTLLCRFWRGPRRPHSDRCRG
ncbi:hypothetical protein NDU88_002944 [Pleurodeles waltl]|uniref:Uncharacterized protein n=1 Tax=Pleurodeles waltl TaxID=8319 RepID=A0AAV7KW64_PLEWA|nr:hypothetical protein NDU88_002944 [Pleurodeles waltl]